MIDSTLQQFISWVTGVHKGDRLFFLGILLPPLRLH
jgi:hypothetical protein